MPAKGEAVRRAIARNAHRLDHGIRVGAGGLLAYPGFVESGLISGARPGNALRPGRRCCPLRVMVASRSGGDKYD